MINFRCVNKVRHISQLFKQTELLCSPWVINIPWIMMKITSILLGRLTIHDECSIKRKFIVKSFSMMDWDPTNQCECLNEGFQYYFYPSYQRVIYFLRWSDPIVAWPHNQDIILQRANILIVQEQYFYQSYPTIIYWNYFSRSLNLEISCRRQICSEAFNHNFFFVM